MPSLQVNPTAEQIETVLAAAIAAANNGCRQRLVSDYQVETWPAIVANQPEGVLSCDGGAVPNAYTQRAETTSAKVAWWTDGRGRKSVRITACRTWARHTSYGKGSGVAVGDQSPWSATFPDRAAKLTKARRDRLARLLDQVGPEGEDDRLAIRSVPDRHLVAASPEGLLIGNHATRPKVVQVVVRDATTGQRHHITVPPKFATPASKTYQKLGSSAARVHAAIAWTFDLAPAAYAPNIEA